VIPGAGSTKLAAIGNTIRLTKTDAMTKSKFFDLVLVLLTIFFLSVIFTVIDLSPFSKDMTAYDVGYQLGNSSGVMLKYMLKLTFLLGLVYLVFRMKSK
jgi:hypothetical protein